MKRLSGAALLCALALGGMMAATPRRTFAADVCTQDATSICVLNVTGTSSGVGQVSEGGAAVLNTANGSQLEGSVISGGATMTASNGSNLLGSVVNGGASMSANTGASVEGVVNNAGASLSANSKGLVSGVATGSGLTGFSSGAPTLGGAINGGVVVTGSTTPTVAYANNSGASVTNGLGWAAGPASVFVPNATTPTCGAGATGVAIGVSSTGALCVQTGGVSVTMP